MKKFRIASFIGVLILLVLFSFILIPNDIKLTEAVSNYFELETQLQRIVEEGGTPGMALVVVKKDKIVYNKAFGMADSPENIMATPETVWRWWSLTKSVTAMAILKLQEDGLLNINDDVLKYLPFLTMNYRNEINTVVTIKDLLNHSSGIPDNIPEIMGWMHFEGEPEIDQTELLKRVFAKYGGLKFRPGMEGSSYSNVGYMVLGSIIEKVSGLNYDEYVETKILKPLAMENTGFRLTETMRKNFATGSHPFFSMESAILWLYNIQDMGKIVRKVKGGRIWFHTFYPDSVPPSGLMGTAEDAAKLVMVCLNDGELNGGRILKKESIDQLLYEGYSNPNKMSKVKPFGDKDFKYGRGWFINMEKNELVIRNNGGAPGFGTTFCLYPQKSMGIILMANDMHVNSNEIIRLVTQIDW